MNANKITVEIPEVVIDSEIVTLKTIVETCNFLNTAGLVPSVAQLLSHAMSNAGSAFTVGFVGTQCFIVWTR